MTAPLAKSLGRKNGDFSIPMRMQTLRTSWKQAYSKWISAENESAAPPEQEVLAGMLDVFSTKANYK